MYKRYNIYTKYTVREVYTVFSQCMLVVCLGVALKGDCLLFFFCVCVCAISQNTVCLVYPFNHLVSGLSETFTDTSSVLVFFNASYSFSVKLYLL